MNCYVCKKPINKQFSLLFWETYNGRERPHCSSACQGITKAKKPHMPEHALSHETTDTSGQHWYCPTCGRHVLYLPAGGMQIIEPGDQFARHSGREEELWMSAVPTLGAGRVRGLSGNWQSYRNARSGLGKEFEMDLGNFAKWFACQVEIDSADRTAERAMDAACTAIAKSSDFHGQGAASDRCRHP